MDISRESIWDSAYNQFKSQSFCISQGYLQVTFVSDDTEEDGYDTGGLRREFFSLLQPALVKDSGVFRGICH